MKKLQELSLKIEDLEERIAPHITVYLPDQAALETVEGHPQVDLSTLNTDQAMDAVGGAKLHATLGPNIPDTEVYEAPHFK